MTMSTKFSPADMDASASTPRSCVNGLCTFEGGVCTRCGVAEPADAHGGLGVELERVGVLMLQYPERLGRVQRQKISARMRTTFEALIADELALLNAVSVTR